MPIIMQVYSTKDYFYALQAGIIWFTRNSYY